MICLLQRGATWQSVTGPNNPREAFPVVRVDHLLGLALDTVTMMMVISLFWLYHTHTMCVFQNCSRGSLFVVLTRFFLLFGTPRGEEFVNKILIYKVYFGYGFTPSNFWPSILRVEVLWPRVDLLLGKRVLRKLNYQLPSFDWLLTCFFHLIFVDGFRATLASCSGWRKDLDLAPATKHCNHMHIRKWGN